MDQSKIIKPQDVAILVKLLTKLDENWRQVDIAAELGLSQGEVAKSLARLTRAELVHNKKPKAAASLEFLVHAIKYVFPVQAGPLSIGVPTATSAPFHLKMVSQNKEDVFVWPSVSGKKRGQSIVPFYANLAEAALKDEKFYEMMSAIEILRMGRAREKKLAENFLRKKLELV